MLVQVREFLFFNRNKMKIDTSSLARVTAWINVAFLMRIYHWIASDLSDARYLVRILRIFEVLLIRALLNSVEENARFFTRPTKKRAILTILYISFRNFYTNFKSFYDFYIHNFITLENFLNCLQIGAL